MQISWLEYIFPFRRVLYTRAAGLKNAAFSFTLVVNVSYRFQRISPIDVCALKRLCELMTTDRVIHGFLLEYRPISEIWAGRMVLVVINRAFC